MLKIVFLINVTRKKPHQRARLYYIYGVCRAVMDV